MRKTILVLPLVIALVAALAFALVQQDSSEAGEVVGAGAFMSLEVNGEKGKVAVDTGSSFKVSVIAKEIPASGYVFAQAWISWGNTGLTFKDSTTTWPDCEFTTKVEQNDAQNASRGCLTSFFPPQPASFYQAELFSFILNCTFKGPHTIDLLAFGHPLAGTSGALFTDGEGEQIVPDVSGVNVNCVNPNLTPTPAKPATVTALCVPADGSPDDPDKCKYDVGDTFTVLGAANFAQDTDKNETAGYHGVEIAVSWDETIGGNIEKSSDVFCPPGGLPDKEPPLVDGFWVGTCQMPSQADPDKVPPCPIQPDLPFPDPGCDTFDSGAAFKVDLINPDLGVLQCDLAGPTQITRSAVGDSQPNGFDDIQTEIVFMQLTGFCGAIPVTVHESPIFNSIGLIEEQNNNNPGVLDFPASSFFDVFVEIDTPIGTFHNDNRIDMFCKIDDIPPFLCEYGSIITPQLFDDSHKLVGTIEHALHIPKKTLVGPSFYEVELNCLQAGSYTVTVGATFTREEPKKDPVATVFDTVEINCNPPNLTPTPSKPAAVTVFCVPVVGQPDPIECKYNVGDTFFVVGLANFAQDTDKNDTAGYHGVAVNVSWPLGLDPLKSSDMFCPPGGAPGKAPPVPGNWTGTCQLPSQADPDKVPPCPIQPDLPFPDPGCDTFDSLAAFKVDFTNPPLGSLQCDLAGPTQITRTAVIPGALDRVDTEIVFMQLTGFCNGTIPVTVHESATLNSTGSIVEQKNNASGTLEFPADSFFDVFVEVETPLGTFHNKVGIDMACKIDGIPPYLCEYGSTLAPQLFDDTQKVVGTIEHALHIPKKTLVGASAYEVELNCALPGTFAVSVSATFTREEPKKDQVGPVVDSVVINCNAPPSYNRIVVEVGVPDQLFKVAGGTFICQSNGEVVPAVFKDHLKDVNPDDPEHIHHEVWSGTFSKKCLSAAFGATFTLNPVIPNNALLIKVCRVENTSSGASAECNVSPNPGIPPGPQDFKATLKPPKLPKPGDTDGDGCPDVHENRPKAQANQGGGRDYLDPNDYYDVYGSGQSLVRDGVIDLANDILGVIQHFAPLGTEPEYDVRFDRGPRTGANTWNMGPPDGVIDLANDILSVILQFQHNCR